MLQEKNIRIDLVIGTRPEAIKMAPVALELKKRSCFDVRVVATGQHTDMLRQALDYFGLVADVDLKIMKRAQSLDYITSSVLEGVGRTFDENMPHAVLVHGDTTTTFASTLAAFYRKIPVGHVEAGLRSFDMDQPFPEEMNRVVTDRMATWWFAPTSLARENLLREGVCDDRIYVTGNTVVDALHRTLESGASPSDPAITKFADGRKFILLTAHRRESWGEPLEHICRAVLRILDIHPDLGVLAPMHKNPAVRKVMTKFLGDSERVLLCDPLDYPNFVWAINKSTLILSDSGGVQEEATALSKPLVILREVTERPEAVESGSGILAGTDEEKIFEESENLLSNEEAYKAVQRRCSGSPFGDGHASERIADVLAASI